MINDCPFYIVSAPSEELTELANDLDKLEFDFAPCSGSYKGELEESFIVFDSDTSQLDTRELVIDVAKSFGQESILIVDSKQNAKLYYVASGASVIVGKFTAVSDSEALSREAYTLFNDQYYVTR